MDTGKTLFEDFTSLNWVKWNKRKPEHNGSLYVRWNGKFTSNAHVSNGVLTSLDGEPTDYEYVNQKIVAKYTENQIKILEDLYWLEEIHHFEALEKYYESLPE